MRPENPTDIKAAESGKGESEMATWIQINAVFHNDLEDQSKVKLLEDLGIMQDRGGDFVEITDGDQTKHYDVDLSDILTPSELIERIEEGGYHIVSIDKDIACPEESRLGEMAESIKPGYWTRRVDYALNPKQLVMVEPENVEFLWIGNPANLPRDIVDAYMPPQDDEGKEGYRIVESADAIHKELIKGENNLIAGKDGNAPEDAACWFEWREIE
jgi:hypothetical protein